MNRGTKGTVVALAAAMLALAGCAGQNYGENEAAGTIIGGAAGGLIGASVSGRGDSKVVGAALGTFIGAAVGNSIGRKLDEVDRLRLAHAQQRALESTPSGNSVAWSNPDSGNTGTVTPRPAFQNAQGQYCREFTQTIIVGGEEVEGYGTACRQPDGSWRIVDG